MLRLFYLINRLNNIQFFIPAIMKIEKHKRLFTGLLYINR